MADDAGSTAPKTPARNSVLSPLRSTPQTVGSAVVSEHIGIVGVGRATTVFTMKNEVISTLPGRSYFLNKSTELVDKLFWPEEARQSEPDILEEDVLGHVPEMVWSYMFDGTSTAIIRRAPGFDNAELGHRVLYIIMFKKLTPITTLEKEEFLIAWWDVVKCHRVLWKRGVHHHGVRPSNLMGYHLDGQFISVLNDFDLSIKHRPEGFERTGMVPFMSVELLTSDAIAGEVEHVYQHDAESFIWVLVWVCLRYEDRKLLSKNRPLDEWLKLDALRCRVEKFYFLTMWFHNKKLRAPISHNEPWMVAKKCLATLYSYGGPLPFVPADDEVVFQTLLQDHVPADVREGNLLSCL